MATFGDYNILNEKRGYLAAIWPSNSLQTLFKIAGSLEIKEDNIGLTFKNINRKVYGTTALRILISMICTFVAFQLLMAYIWPISHVNRDNKKINPCYCFMPSFYRRKKNTLKSDYETVEERMSTINQFDNETFMGGVQTILS